MFKNNGYVDTPYIFGTQKEQAAWKACCVFLKRIVIKK